MALVAYLLRADLRRRWRSWVALVLLIAVAGGVSMFAIAGWRRTTSAMDRFLVEFQPADAVVIGPSLDHDALVGLDEIEAADGGEYFLLVPDGPDGRPEPGAVGSVNPFSSSYGENFHQMGKARLIQGRFPDPDAELEVAIDEELAQTFDVGVGDIFPMTALTPDQLQEEGGGRVVLQVAAGTRFDFEVTSIIRRPSDVVPSNSYDADVVYLGTREVYLTPAFHREHYQRDVAGASLLNVLNDSGLEYLEIRLRPGTEPSVLRDRIDALGGDTQTFFEEGDDAQAARISDRAIGLQATAVLAVGIVIAVAASVLALLAATRLLAEQLGDLSVRRAIGVERSVTMLAAVLSVAGAAGIGSLGAGALAIALSPASPIGLARRAEPDPGVAIDWTVLAVGPVLIVVAAAVVAAVTSARAITRAGRSSQPARPTLTTRLARGASRPGVVCGLQLGGGARGVHTTTIATVLLAHIAVVGSLTFAASAARLHDEPRHFGWGWDVVVGNPNDGDLFQRLLDGVADQPTVGSATAVLNACGGRFDLDGRTATADLVALDPLRGAIGPEPLAGRAPTGSAEIALGAVTAQRLHASVGDTVMVTSEDCGDRSVPMELTGIALFNDGLLADRIGEGAVVAADSLERLGVEAEQGVVLVDYAEGVSDEEGYAGLREEYGRTVLRARTPEDLDSLDRVRRLPLLVAAVVGVLALATLAFTLGSVVRRRRRDLAILKATGLGPRQAAEALYVHAASLVAIPAAAGTLLGLVAGQLAWGYVTRGLGAPDLAVFPVAAAILAVPGTVLAALAIAMRPAHQAARTRPSIALRTE